MNEPHSGNLYIPKYIKSAPPHADTAALRDAAKLLVNAENPVIVVDRMARSQNGVKLLVQLAELVQVPVVDQSTGMNFPNTINLNQREQAQALIRNADLIVVSSLDFWNTVNLFNRQRLGQWIGARQSRVKPAPARHHKLGRTQPEIQLPGLPALPVRRYFHGRGRGGLAALFHRCREVGDLRRPQGSLREARRSHEEGLDASHERSRQTAAVGWNAAPISVPRLNRGSLGADQGYGLFAGIVARGHRGGGRTGCSDGTSPSLAWRFSGARRCRYGLPASVGAAHANNKLGRFSVSFQGDGDMMFAPGAHVDGSAPTRFRI